MKISVITVCHNAEKTIRHTLDSFCLQSHPEKELLVIDGASRDDTLAIVNSYRCDSIRVYSEPDFGMYDALNKGLQLYSGDGFGVLNADDSFHDPFGLSHIAAGLKRSALVHGHLDFVENHVSKKTVRKWRGVLQPARSFKSGWMPAHPTFYARREVVDRVGLFDLSFATASDYDWMLRAIDICGFDVSLIDRVLIDMQKGGRSTRGLLAHLKHNIEALKARQKWLNAGAIDYALFAKPMRKIEQLFVPSQMKMSSPHEI
jgi:glycosyltransferase involved in cell wall biosynthesis